VLLPSMDNPHVLATLNFSLLIFLLDLSDDLADLGEIGRGGFGTVNKMIFKKNNKVMAVKRIRCSNVVDEKEQKRIMVRIINQLQAHCNKAKFYCLSGFGCSDEII
jgi:serine/threonine protein kinase